jgi:hypothetical protein
MDNVVVPRVKKFKLDWVSALGIFKKYQTNK